MPMKSVFQPSPVRMSKSRPMLARPQAMRMSAGMVAPMTPPKSQAAPKAKPAARMTIEPKLSSGMAHSMSRPMPSTSRTTANQGMGRFVDVQR